MPRVRVPVLACVLTAARSGGGRGRGQHEDDRINGFDQRAQAGLPFLALLKGMAVDRYVKATVELKPGDQFIGELGVGAGIGDENLELLRLTLR